MNKILNWTFGSLFRTIGRLFGFLIVFLLLLIIGSKFGFKLPDYLMPLKINAATLDFSVNQSLVCVDRSGTQTCTSFKDNPYDANPTYPVELIKYRLKTGSGFKADSTYTINFGYKPTPDAIQFRNIQFQFSGSDDYETNFTCTGWNLNNLGYYRNVCDFTPSVDVDNTEYLYIYVRFYPSYLTTIRPSLLSEYNVVEGVGSIIKDQTNQIIQGQEDLKNEITNDDTTGAEDSASGFFNNFNTDTFGLTSIITAPLNAINSLINSSCSNLILPLPFIDKNINLPCMTTIYSNYFKGFFDLYQIITTGLISYYIIVRIFNLVKDFKNPEHDEIEVVDL